MVKNAVIFGASGKCGLELVKQAAIGKSLLYKRRDRMNLLYCFHRVTN